MPDRTYIIAAYVATWVGILGYALRLAVRMRHARTMSDAMEEP